MVVKCVSSVSSVCLVCVKCVNSLGPKIIIIHACALPELSMRLANVQLTFGVETSTCVCEAFWLVLHPCATYPTFASLVESYL